MMNMNTLLAAGFIGGWELVLILAVVLVLFGAKKLPELAKGLGQGIKEFKKATREVTDEIQSAMDETPPPARPYPNTYSEPTASTATTAKETPANGTANEGNNPPAPKVL